MDPSGILKHGRRAATSPPEKQVHIWIWWFSTWEKNDTNSQTDLKSEQEFIAHVKLNISVSLKSKEWIIFHF